VPATVVHPAEDCKVFKNELSFIASCKDDDIFAGKKTQTKRKDNLLKVQSPLHCSGNKLISDGSLGP